MSKLGVQYNLGEFRKEFAHKILNLLVKRT